MGVCIDSERQEESLQRDRAVCISTNGAVFVNGKEMTNQLPAVGLGSAVTFDMSAVTLQPGDGGGGFRLRVAIGSGNREVVFDWPLERPADSLCFGCSFAHAGWKVLVF